VPPINKDRAHALVSVLVVLAALTYGALQLPGQYGQFRERYEEQLFRDWVPRHYGKTYGAWRAQRTQECLKSADAEKSSRSTPFPLEEKAQLENGCQNAMPIEFFMGISKSDEYLAFTRDAAPRTVGYVIVVLIWAWVVGFAVAKAIPSLVLGVARWLTGPKKE
jgi:hypothetical protein